MPVGYLLARGRFPGRAWLDAALDIPIVLPPMVVGLCLLIDQRLAHRRISPKPSSILLTLAMVWCCGHVPAAAGSSDPNRVGEYVVRLNLTCNGTAASSVSSDGITATSKDAFSGSIG